MDPAASSSGIQAGPDPLLVAIEMGYGHMRPATALGQALGVDVLACDRPPLASPRDMKVWRRVRRFYEWLTRTSTTAWGRPLRPLVRSATEIEPFEPGVDLSRPTWPVRRFAKSIRKGLGDQLVAELRSSGRPLLTTYFGPALAADAAGLDDIYLVATDSDLHRVWAPLVPQETRITYLVAAPRAAERLEAYGVPSSRIHLTGFPLPGALLGGRDLATCDRHLATRLAHLDPEGRFRERLSDELLDGVGALPAPTRPSRLTFAIGGAGAQARLVRTFLPRLRDLIRGDALRVSLVAGVREDARRALHAAVRAAGLTGVLRADPASDPPLEILAAEDLPAYFAAFNELLARTDVLWTKPSELTFFAGLGIPLVFAPPVGMHEAENRRWAEGEGAGVRQGPPAEVDQWLPELIRDGTLAEAAWAGRQRLPTNGLFEIVDRVSRGG